MKKRVTLVLALCALALTIPLSAIAGNGPGNKVTGDMWFTNSGMIGMGHFTFSGHDLGTAGLDKGTASYTDNDGSWSGKTTDVTVNSGIATMTVVVTSTTHPAVLPGSTHKYTFVDNGEGANATGADYFLYGSDPTQFTAQAGNIQVHLYS